MRAELAEECKPANDLPMTGIRAVFSCGDFPEDVLILIVAWAASEQSVISNEPISLTFVSRRPALPVGYLVLPPPFLSNAAILGASS